MNTWIKNILIVVIALGLVSAASVWYVRREKSTESPFRTAPITRGDIVATISATGTVEPEEVIDVGAQVAGRITEFGKDKAGKSIDYGSQVEEGMVLALVDPSVYQSQVDQVDAQVKQAEAGVTRAEADLGQFQAKLTQAQRDWDRAQKIGPSDAMAQVDYDAYQSAFDSAKANVEVGKAAVEQAKRAVLQQSAQLKLAKQNLGYCTIASPVKGVIIDRRVNIGQTVVASLSAPSLFLLAKDLNRMQVWVAVNEADIGNIHPGQKATFTADAFPGQTFEGEVSKVRLNATMTQNVVTYTVEVTTDNSSGKLLPYLTANVSFETNRHDDVLMVPNAALRWTPQAEQVAPDVRDAVASASTEPVAPRSERRNRDGAGGGGRQRSTTRPAGSASADPHRPGTIWVVDGNYVRPVEVISGLSDGKNTEIRGEKVTENMQVVIGETQQGGGAGGGANTNPFIPQFRRPGQSSGGGGGGQGGGGQRGGGGGR
jgi:HlyD family secretion protein